MSEKRRKKGKNMTKRKEKGGTESHEEEKIEIRSPKIID